MLSRYSIRIPHLSQCVSRRLYSSGENNVKKGLILGVYEAENSTEEGNGTTNETSSSFEEVNKTSSGRLGELLKIAGPVKKGKNAVFYGVKNEYPAIAVVGLGKKSAGFNELDEINESSENVRVAVASGAKALREVGCMEIEVDSCSDAHAAAEGSCLSLFSYDELKEESKRKKEVKLSLFDSDSNKDIVWKRGMTYAESQNFTRTLMEAPGNVMTPANFANRVSDRLNSTGSNFKINVYEKDWINSQKMGAFLSVAKGSEEPPLFLEVIYNGADSDTKPLVLVGKGITFDSGGISIKPAQAMDLMRGDMGGAANVAGALYAIGQLKVPLNVVGLIPLCENLINGIATKPGDVVTAMNGKTIQVDNTDAEGRLILADALCYACQEHKPSSLIDLATLTGAIDVALGAGSAGVFSNNLHLWNSLQKSGVATGDRLWRMPLFKLYSDQIKESQLADLNNIGKHSRSGGSCTAAAFLREFVTCDSWAHMDIAGVMMNKDEIPYLGKGMSGRPVRTLIEYMCNLSS